MRLTQEGTRPSWSLLALRWLCCSLGSLGAGGAGVIWGVGGNDLNPLRAGEGHRCFRLSPPGGGGEPSPFSSEGALSSL